MASIQPVNSYLQERDKEKEKQKAMMEELKLLCENIGLTSHVKALMKETSTKRKELINTSDSINTVISNFPFLLKADMILFELSLRVNVKVTDIFEKVDTFIIELGAYLKISNDTSAENRKITILQKIYSIYKLKRMPKNVPPLFTVEEVSSPPGEELTTKETEGSRLARI